MEAVFLIEKYIYQCKPKTKEDLADATYDIANAAIAALISTIGATKTRNFLKLQVEIIKKEFLSNFDVSSEIIEGLH